MLAVALTNLLEVAFPSGTVRWSEGAAIRWGSDVFMPRHATYGAVAGAESLSEGIGNEVPAMRLTIHPPSTSAAADLVQPGSQQARVRAWLARYDPQTATVTGTPDLTFDGFLDQARLVRGPGKFALECAVVSLLERLFELNTGNSLNPTFHKSIWPGEGGEDHATGLVLQDAWGVESPVSTSTVSSGTGKIWWQGGTLMNLK